MKISQVLFLATLITFCSVTFIAEKARMRKKTKASACCCDIFTIKGPREIGWKSFDGRCDYLGCLTSKNVCSDNVSPLTNENIRDKFTKNIYRGVTGTKPCCCTMIVNEKRYDVHWTINSNNNICNFANCENGSPLSDADCLEKYSTSHRAVWTDIKA